MENLTDLIKVTSCKLDFADNKADLSYYGQLLDILNNLNEPI